MNIQWYPGHMTKAKRMMTENLKLVDVVIEILDARIPISSRNPEINQIANNKPRIIVLNKIDLADEAVTNKWAKWFEKEGASVIQINSQNGKGMNGLVPLTRTVCKAKIDRDKKRGLINSKIRAMVVGIPNVGKSTFINKLVGKASAKTGNKPGVTKGKQWIKLKKDVELLDTPGMLWPKFEDQQVGINLAMIGSIKEEILDARELCFQMIVFMQKEYPKIFLEKYAIEDFEHKEPMEVLTATAQSRNLLKSGSVPDTDRMAKILLEEFRNGKFGKLSIEKVPEEALI
jgi:ribosome biogenesis GTPase A